MGRLEGVETVGKGGQGEMFFFFFHLKDSGNVVSGSFFLFWGVIIFTTSIKSYDEIFLERNCMNNEIYGMNTNL